MATFPRTKKKVLVVANDAGGAEIVSAYLLAKKEYISPHCIVRGPAARIFERKGLRKRILKTEDARGTLARFPGISLVLTGTSARSALERDALRAAKERGIRSAAYLDHWVGYRERFGYPRAGWRKTLPTELWVGDHFALRKARSLFGKKVRIRYVRNHFFDETITLYRRARMGARGRRNPTLMFVSQPHSALRGPFAKGTPDEIALLRRLCHRFALVPRPPRILVRLHPAEKRRKYRNLARLFTHRLSIKESASASPWNEVARSSCIVGIDSMLLYLAALVGKKVVSISPRKLPFPPGSLITRVPSLRRAIPLLSSICRDNKTFAV
jgi:hypothetical protein